MGPNPDPAFCAEQQIPICTSNPRECELCDWIKNIFKGFPTERDPGCETGTP
jgi:hypothetical protein